MKAADVLTSARVEGVFASFGRFIYFSNLGAGCSGRDVLAKYEKW